MKGTLLRIAERVDIDLIEAEAIADHVHLLLRLRGAQTLSSAMHRLKGGSAREVLLAYPELKLDMRSESLWQRGYGWRRVSEDQLFRVRNYIRTQELRPLRHEQ